MSFKEMILSDMPSNLTDLEKARFVYLKLATIGYGIEQKKIPGVIFPRIFMPSIIDKKILKYRLFPHTVPLYMQPYNVIQQRRIG